MFIFSLNMYTYLSYYLEFRQTCTYLLNYLHSMYTYLLYYLEFRQTCTYLLNYSHSMYTYLVVLFRAQTNMYLPVLLFENYVIICFTIQSNVCNYLLYYLEYRKTCTYLFFTIQINMYLPVYLLRQECIYLLYYLDKLVLNLCTAKINMCSPTVLQQQHVYLKYWQYSPIYSEIPSPCLMHFNLRLLY